MLPTDTHVEFRADELPWQSHCFSGFAGLLSSSQVIGDILASLLDGTESGSSREGEFSGGRQRHCWKWRGGGRGRVGESWGAVQERP